MDAVDSSSLSVRYYSMSVKSINKSSWYPDLRAKVGSSVHSPPRISRTSRNTVEWNLTNTFKLSYCPTVLQTICRNTLTHTVGLRDGALNTVYMIPLGKLKHLILLIRPGLIHRFAEILHSHRM